jgi:hypothetical protein
LYYCGFFRKDREKLYNIYLISTESVYTPKTIAASILRFLLILLATRKVGSLLPDRVVFFLVLLYKTGKKF